MSADGPTKKPTKKKTAKKTVKKAAKKAVKKAAKRASAKAVAKKATTKKAPTKKAPGRAAAKKPRAKASARTRRTEKTEKTERRTYASTLKIQQVRSAIGSPRPQRLVLGTLGLRRIRHVVEREDSPAVRGAVAKIPHLVRVIED